MSTVNQAPVLTTSDANGIVRLDLGNFTVFEPNVVLQADGKMVVNGYALGPGNYSALARYNADGSLDTAFGTDGVVWTEPAFAPGANVALQADGKLVVVADNFAVTRYNSDGSLDTSFGTGGTVTPHFGTFAAGLVIQADGKIVVAGEDSPGFGLARYDSNGNLDSSFGVGGKVTTSFGSSVSAQAFSLISQPDGKLVVTGSAFSGGKDDFALARYNVDGSLDTTFGSGGEVTTDFASASNAAYSATLQADGKIVVAGMTDHNANFALARYNVDGSLDASFGTGGRITTDLGSDFRETADSVKIQADGKIVVAGYSGFLGAVLLRYNSDGSLDSSFGNGGKVQTNLQSEADDVVIQPDGKFLLVGGIDIGIGHDLALARYNSDGSLDTSFGNGTGAALNGPAFFVEDGSPTPLNAVATVHDAELVAAGSYAGASLTLARHGGANAEDVFGASGNLAALSQGGDVTLSGVAIGTVTQNTGGTLVLTFGANATEARVNEAMRDITYANTSDTPAASAQIDWSFSDGNTGAQGSGGALTATGSTTVILSAVNDQPVNTVPGPLEVIAGADYAIAGLSVSDRDSASVDISFRMDHGTLAVPEVGDARVLGGGTGFVTIFGSIAQVNAALAGATYHSAPGFTGADTLRMDTSDDYHGPGILGFDSDTIAINVVPGPGSVSINDVTVSEGDSGSKVATFTVTRSGGTAAFDVDFATSDGGATTADHDYAANSGTLNFGAGVDTQTISVTINGDTKFESDEAFSVNLSGATNGATISDDSGTATITNDDAAAGSVSINDVSIAEGNSGTKVETFTVTRSGGTAAFDVNFSTADNSATVADHDYAAKSGTLHFDAGVNSQTIAVTVNVDTKFEANEAFYVNLSGATNDALISDSQGIGTIQNDDLNRARSDFNADTTSDVFWRNNSTGHVGTWEMHNNVQTWHDLGGSGVDHKVAGIGDFNGDGTADLFWRDDSFGHVGIWEMHNNVPTWHDLGGSEVDHKVVGIGDFNGDGTADVLWRNDSTGNVETWEMHDNVQTSHDLGGSGLDHKVVGVGDFNADGTADVLWRNDSSGHVGIWEMHNNVQTWHDLGSSGVDHKVVGVGDFNGDGTSDVLWRNDSTGHVGIWEMHNNVQTWHDLGGSGTDFKVAGIGDYNGDGTSDVVWRNDSNGHVGIWEMHDNVQAWHDLGLSSGVDHSLIV